MDRVIGDDAKVRKDLRFALVWRRGLSDLSKVGGRSSRNLKPNCYAKATLPDQEGSAEIQNISYLLLAECLTNLRNYLTFA